MYAWLALIMTVTNVGILYAVITDIWLTKTNSWVFNIFYVNNNKNYPWRPRLSTYMRETKAERSWTQGKLRLHSVFKLPLKYIDWSDIKIVRKHWLIAYWQTLGWQHKSVDSTTTIIGQENYFRWKLFDNLWALSCWS